MTEIINIRTRLSTWKESKEDQKKDSSNCLKKVLEREPRSVLILSWNNEIDEGFDIDYCDLMKLSDAAAVLEIAKAKLIKENYN